MLLHYIVSIIFTCFPSTVHLGTSLIKGQYSGEINVRTRNSGIKYMSRKEKGMRKIAIDKKTSTHICYVYVIKAEICRGSTRVSFM